MLFPKNFEEKLGFDLIRQMLEGFCLSDLGTTLVGEISFSTDSDEIVANLSLTQEMKTILQFEENFPAQDYYDMIPELIRIRIAGTYIEPEQLSELKLSLTSIKDIHQFISLRKEKYPHLFQLSSIQHPASSIANEVSIASRIANEVSIASSIQHLASVIKQVDTLIDDRSQVRDNASPELLRIRREKRAKEASVDRKSVLCFKEAKKNGWTPGDSDVTVRNGRLVIPLLSAHKRKLPGLLHDESATGQTVYIEPAEIVEINNEIRELEYAERREIIRILTAFADSLRPFIDELIRHYHFLGEIDFVRAKAMFAVTIDAGCSPLPASPNRGRRSCIPDPASRAERASHPASRILHRERSEHRILDPASVSFTWYQAVHPLLYLSHKKQKKKVVPLDISLNGNERILIISGPNAGGKSVCLKTVGLVQYMFQCGLLPPVREDSEFSIFNKIFIDIGDDQSIDNDLSTYSGKLMNLKFFIENIDQHSLFLIDELGTGTDPALGGPIAEATLETLNSKGAFGLVTTHYSNLKLLSGREEGIVNGAMLYDSKKLKPLFQLKIGKPGSSFAFEIAHEIGFPEDVLEKAKQKTGTSQLDFDRELQNLEVEKQEITKKETELNVADELLSGTIQKYHKLKEDLERSKNEILEKARNEAKHLLDESNKLIERTIREIRENQADKERTKIARAEVNNLKKKLMPDPAPGIQHPASRIPDPASRILPPVPKSPYQGYVDDLNRKLLSFELTLDLRGKRVDEAIAMIQNYIDDATMLSIQEVRILHGKGNGILRQVTRDYLRSRKEVKSAKDELLERGGAGVTVVAFK